MNQFTLSLEEQPFDLPLCVQSGQVFRFRELSPCHWQGVDGAHFYDISWEENLYTVKTNAEQARFSEFFSLDVDTVSMFQELAVQEPTLAQAIQERQGMRLLKPYDPVETLITFCCTPNNNMARILKMVQFLAEKGTLIKGTQLHAFPSLETVAELDESELRQNGFGYRAATIPAVARQSLERGGSAWLLSLRGVTYAEAHSELCSLKGIGPKLADCICLFGLRHTVAVPIDTHLWQQVTMRFLPELEGKPLTEKLYKRAQDALVERFGKNAGWAQQFMFHDNLVNARTYRKSRINP